MTPCERNTSNGYAGTLVMRLSVLFSFDMAQESPSSLSSSSALATEAANSSSSRDNTLHHILKLLMHQWGSVHQPPALHTELLVVTRDLENV